MVFLVAARLTAPGEDEKPKTAPEAVPYGSEKRFLCVATPILIGVLPLKNKVEPILVMSNDVIISAIWVEGVAHSSQNEQNWQNYSEHFVKNQKLL